MDYSFKKAVSVLVFLIIIPEVLTSIYALYHENSLRYTLQAIQASIGILVSIFLIIICARGLNSSDPNKSLRIGILIISATALVYFVFGLGTQFLVQNISIG